MTHPTDSSPASGDLTFQPGDPSQPKAAAALIYQSSHELLDYMFSNQAIAERVLSRLYRKRSGHFSHRFSTSALIDEELVGLELGYSKEQLKREEFPGSINLLFSSPLSVSWHLATKAGSVIDGYVPKPSDGAYYINNIAVSPDARGRGIGERLLSHVIDRSRKAGYSAVELDVTTVNEGAIRFYERHGFTKQSESGSQELMDQFGLPPLARMNREL